MPIIGYEKKKPGSYSERVKSVNSISTNTSASVSGAIGTTIRGPIGKAIKVISWKDFTNKFAYGYEDPFILGTFSLEVYDFFENGGSDLYITRLIGTGALASTLTVGETGSITALEVGAWGNNLKVIVKEDNGSFVCETTLSTKSVEVLTEASLEELVATVNLKSKFITATELVVGEYALAGGTDGTIAQADYVKALATYDLPKVNLLAIPGAGEEVQKALNTYCINSTAKGKRVFPLLDTPAVFEDLVTLEEYKAKFIGYNGAMYYPHQVVLNPIDGETEVTISPILGILGLYNRTDNSRGIHKAPAGMEANLVNAIGVTHELTDDEIGYLNSKNINCLMPKQGFGILVWGARILTVDGERKFVSDLRLDNFVEDAIEDGTLWATFEPIDDSLFSRLNSNITEFLNKLWEEGKFKGASPEEAYIVTVDESNNPDPDADYVIIEVGYAKKKPAEFVVTRISHKRNK